MTNRKQILIENTMWVYMAKIVTQLVSLWASVIVLRRLDVEIYGTYVFLFGLFTAYQLFIISPLKHVLLRFVPELRRRVKPASLRKLILSYIVLAFMIVGLVTIIAVLFKDVIAEFFNINSFSSHLPAFLIFVFSYASKLLMEIVLSAFLLHRIIAKLNIIVVFVRAIFYLSLLSSLNVDTLLCVEAVVSLIYVIPAAIVLIKQGAYHKGLNQDISPDVKSRMKRFWGYSFFTELGAGLIGRTSDYYIVAAMSSPYFVGLYGFAVKVYELFYKLLPVKEFESVLKPLFFEKYTNQSSAEELNYFYNFSIKVLLPLFIFPCLYFLIFGKLIIVEIFGYKYLEAYWTAVIILSGLIMNGLFYPLVIIIQLKEKLHLILISRIIVGFSIAGGIIMMKHWGLVGVALATFIGEVFKNLLMLRLFKPYCRIKYDRQLMNYTFLILLGIGFYWIFGDNINHIWLAIIVSICFVFLYVVYLLNFHPLNSKETNHLVSIISANRRLFYGFKFCSKILSNLIFVKRQNE